jgi:hypothetical protein
MNFSAAYLAQNQVQINTYAVEIIIAIVTFIASVGSSMFIAGTRWGEMRTDLRVMADRLAKIEGMFELQLKKREHGD